MKFTSGSSYIINIWLLYGTERWKFISLNFNTCFAELTVAVYINGVHIKTLWLQGRWVRWRHTGILFSSVL